MHYKQFGDVNDSVITYMYKCLDLFTYLLTVLRTLSRIYRTNKSTSLYTHPSTDPITASNGIQIQSTVFPQFTHWTDTRIESQAHRPTHGTGNKPVAIPAYSPLHYNDAAKN